MKKSYKIFIIFFIFLLFANQVFASKLNLQKDNCFYPTQTDMLSYSSESLMLSDKEFDTVCNRIIKNFKSDKNFVNMFNQNKIEYLRYRLILRDTILPTRLVDSTAYGSNYSIYSESYLQELNKNKIKEYKRMVKLYCTYNQENQSNCTVKQLIKLFK